MAEIATYKCSNRLCGYVMRVSHNLHEGDTLFTNHLGLTCSRCVQGTFEMPRLTVLAE